MHIDSSWDGGNGQKFFAYQLHLTNMGDQRLAPPYEVAITGPKFTALWQSWNLEEAKCEGGAITGKVTAGWAALEPGGKSAVVLGLVAKADAEDGEVHSIKVAGQEVSIDAGQG